jgi:hypothetical protein
VWDVLQLVAVACLTVHCHLGYEQRADNKCNLRVSCLLCSGCLVHVCRCQRHRTLSMAVGQLHAICAWLTTSNDLCCASVQLMLLYARAGTASADQALLLAVYVLARHFCHWVALVRELSSVAPVLMALGTAGVCVANIRYEPRLSLYSDNCPCSSIELNIICMV